MLEPKKEKDGTVTNTLEAIIIEFKVHEPGDEHSLANPVSAALRQIEEKQYTNSLKEKGFPAERICKYGFAFEGKKTD